MEFKPENDGIDHINVFSKSRSKLGRMLSNFAHTPFTLDGNKFESVESWWYWTKMNNINKSVLFPIFSDEQLDTIRFLIGKDAKSYFRELHKADSSSFSPEPFELKRTYLQKLEENPDVKKELMENKLPIDHYYMMFDKKISAASSMWTAKLWEEIANPPPLG
jgi:predicted NAD-dependent protein-ADP-ribosyltransferase YbiA (DUF1768 family)